jgi:hypothetical protein
MDKFRELFLGQFEPDYSQSYFGDSEPNVSKMTFSSGMRISVKTMYDNYVGTAFNNWQYNVPSRVQQKQLITFEKVRGNIDSCIPDSQKNEFYRLLSSVDGDVIVEGNLTSFEGIPKKINGRLDLSRCQSLHSLSGIDKYFGKDGFIAERLPLPSTLGYAILGVLKIPKLIGISFNDEFGVSEVGTPNERVNALRTLSDIVNSHMKSKDVITCQRELIENDFDEYATF